MVSAQIPHKNPLRAEANGHLRFDDLSITIATTRLMNPKREWATRAPSRNTETTSFGFLGPDASPPKAPRKRTTALVVGVRKTPDRIWQNPEACNTFDACS